MNVCIDQLAIIIIIVIIISNNITAAAAAAAVVVVVVVVVCSSSCLLQLFYQPSDKGVFVFFTCGNFWHNDSRNDSGDSDCNYVFRLTCVYCLYVVKRSRYVVF